jgi:hypothetical protein
VGSLKFDGVRFVIYSNDHPPRHIHGFLGKTEILVDLLRDDNVALAARSDAIRPVNAKKSDISKVLHLAALHFDELAALWEEIHGKP